MLNQGISRGKLKWLVLVLGMGLGMVLGGHRGAARLWCRVGRLVLGQLILGRLVHGRLVIVLDVHGLWLAWAVMGSRTGARSRTLARALGRPRDRGRARPGLEGGHGLDQSRRSASAQTFFARHRLARFFFPKASPGPTDRHILI